MKTECPECRRKMFFNYNTKILQCPKSKGGCGYTEKQAKLKVVN